MPVRELIPLCPHCGYDLRSGEAEPGRFFCPECGCESNDREIALWRHHATDGQLWRDLMVWISPSIAFFILAMMEAAAGERFLRDFIAAGVAVAAAGAIGAHMTWRRRGDLAAWMRAYEGAKSAVAIAALNILLLVPTILMLSLWGP